MIRVALISAVAGATGFASMALAAPAPSSSATPASIMVFDQAASGNAISVKYLYLPEDGYAAVYRSGDSGRPVGSPLGFAKLSKGDHRDMKLELKVGPKSGEKLWVTL